MPAPEKTLKESAYELRQSRSKLVDDNRVLTEKIVKESRSLSKDEEASFTDNEAKARDIAARISQIERQLAVDGIEATGGASRNSGPLPHEDLGNTTQRYSMMRALKCLAEKRAVDGLEGEVSQELAKRSQKSPQGVLMPRRTNIHNDAHKRALGTTEGAGSIPTILSKDWIELLRNSTKVIEAGATQIEDLVGKFAIPRQNATTTGYWVGESNAPSGSTPTLEQVPFNPHTVGSYTDISRRFFELTNLDSGEEFVKADQAANLGRAVDLAAINGSGSSYTPLGLLQNPGVTNGRIVALGTNGAAPTWAAMVAMHTVVSRGNAADLGTLAYMGNADCQGTLSTTPKTSTWPMFLLENDMVNGKPFHSTQQLPNTFTKGSGTALSAMIYGAWNQLILAYWSGLDVLCDPYTGGNAGTVRVITLQDMDIQVRHNEAFSFILDMISNQT